LSMRILSATSARKYSKKSEKSTRERRAKGEGSETERRGEGSLVSAHAGKHEVEFMYWRECDRPHMRARLSSRPAPSSPPSCPVLLRFSAPLRQPASLRQPVPFPSPPFPARRPLSVCSQRCSVPIGGTLGETAHPRKTGGGGRYSWLDRGRGRIPPIRTRIACKPFPAPGTAALLTADGHFDVDMRLLVVERLWSAVRCGNKEAGGGVLPFA
jgi:hypothetical protein